MFGQREEDAVVGAVLHVLQQQVFRLVRVEVGVYRAEQAVGQLIYHYRALLYPAEVHAELLAYRQLTAAPYLLVVELVVVMLRAVQSDVEVDAGDLAVPRQLLGCVLKLVERGRNLAAVVYRRERRLARPRRLVRVSERTRKVVRRAPAVHDGRRVGYLRLIPRREVLHAEAVIHLRKLAVVVGLLRNAQGHRPLVHRYRRAVLRLVHYFGRGVRHIRHADAVLALGRGKPRAVGKAGHNDAVFGGRLECLVGRAYAARRASAEVYRVPARECLLLLLRLLYGHERHIQMARREALRRGILHLDGVVLAEAQVRKQSSDYLDALTVSHLKRHVRPVLLDDKRLQRDVRDIARVLRGQRRRLLVADKPIVVLRLAAGQCYRAYRDVARLGRVLLNEEVLRAYAVFGVALRHDKGRRVGYLEQVVVKRQSLFA